MKKIILTLSLMAVTSLMANDTMRTEVDLTAGYNKFDSASWLKNTTLFGIRATMYETEVNKYGLQVGYEGMPGIKYEKSSKKTDLHRIYSHVVIDGEEEYSIVPSLFLGGGYEYLTDEIKGEVSQGFVDLGIGFKYHVTENINVGIETRAIGKFNTRDLDFNVNLALGYMLGGKYERKVEPIFALDTNEVKIDTATEAIEPLQERATIIKVPAEDNYATVSPVSSSDVVNTVVVDEAPRYTASTGSYYIQVAAYRSTPTQPLVNKLVRNGYSNTTVQYKNGKKLIVVGPFSSREEASLTLGGVQSVKADAFIKKGK